jgi:hypothetical protein
MTVKYLWDWIAHVTVSLKPRRLKRRKILLLKQNTKRRSKLTKKECSRRDSRLNNQLAPKTEGQKKQSD